MPRNRLEPAPFYAAREHLREAQRLAAGGVLGARTDWTASRLMGMRAARRLHATTAISAIEQLRHAPPGARRAMRRANRAYRDRESRALAQAAEQTLATLLLETSPLTNRSDRALTALLELIDAAPTTGALVAAGAASEILPSGRHTNYAADIVALVVDALENADRVYQADAFARYCAATIDAFADAVDLREPAYGAIVRRAAYTWERHQHFARARVDFDYVGDVEAAQRVTRAYVAALFASERFTEVVRDLHRRPGTESVFSSTELIDAGAEVATTADDLHALARAVRYAGSPISAATHRRLIRALEDEGSPELAAHYAGALMQAALTGTPAGAPLAAQQRARLLGPIESGRSSNGTDVTR